MVVSTRNRSVCAEALVPRQIPCPSHDALTHTTQATARDIFIAKHANERKERWVSGNFVYFRMNKIVDIYFVGGFGTVQVCGQTSQCLQHLNTLKQR